MTQLVTVELDHKFEASVVNLTLRSSNQINPDQPLKLAPYLYPCPLFLPNSRHHPREKYFFNLTPDFLYYINFIGMTNLFEG